MTQLRIPPLTPLKGDESPEERAALYEEYRKEVISLNPSYFDKDRNLLTGWQRIMNLIFGKS